MKDCKNIVNEIWLKVCVSEHDSEYRIFTSFIKVFVANNKSLITWCKLIVIFFLLFYSGLRKTRYSQTRKLIHQHKSDNARFHEIFLLTVNKGHCSFVEFYFRFSFIRNQFILLIPIFCKLAYYLIWNTRK